MPKLKTYPHLKEEVAVEAVVEEDVAVKAEVVAAVEVVAQGTGWTWQGNYSVLYIQRTGKPSRHGKG